LWDDPLFNNNAEAEKERLGDPEFDALRREERLLALEILYIRIEALESRVERWKEAAGRHAWTLGQLLDRANIPRALLESINIDQQVNIMDPDFSFSTWLRR